MTSSSHPDPYLNGPQSHLRKQSPISSPYAALPVRPQTKTPLSVSLFSDLSRESSYGEPALTHLQTFILYGQIGGLFSPQVTRPTDLLGKEGVLRLDQIHNSRNPKLSLQPNRPVWAQLRHVDHLDNTGSRAVLCLFASVEEIVPRAVLLVDSVHALLADQKVSPTPRAEKILISNKGGPLPKLPDFSSFQVTASQHCWLVGSEYVIMDLCKVNKIGGPFDPSPKPLTLTFSELLGHTQNGAEQWCFALAGLPVQGKREPHYREANATASANTELLPQAMRGAAFNMTLNNIHLIAFDHKDQVSFSLDDIVLSASMPIPRSVAKAYGKSALMESASRLLIQQIALSIMDVDLHTASSVSSKASASTRRLLLRDDAGLAATLEADKAAKAEVERRKARNHASPHVTMVSPTGEQRKIIFTAGKPGNHALGRRALHCY